MSKATKAQRNYFENLAKKATTEEIQLAIRIFDEEIGIEASGWGARITEDRFATIAWEKEEISVLIDVLKNPELYIAEEMTEEEAQVALLKRTYPESEVIAEATAEDMTDRAAFDAFRRRLTPEQSRAALELSVNRSAKYFLAQERRDHELGRYDYPEEIKEGIAKMAMEKAHWWNSRSEYPLKEEHVQIDWAIFWEQFKKSQGKVSHLGEVKPQPFGNIVYKAMKMH